MDKINEIKNLHDINLAVLDTKTKPKLNRTFTQGKRKPSEL